MIYVLRFSPIGKQIDGYFRFECPHCGENTNNIDLMMLHGHDFLTAVSILKDWLNQYRHDLGLPEQSARLRSARDESISWQLFQMGPVVTAEDATRANAERSHSELCQSQSGPQHRNSDQFAAP